MILERKRNGEEEKERGKRARERKKRKEKRGRRNERQQQQQQEKGEDRQNRKLSSLDSAARVCSRSRFFFGTACNLNPFIQKVFVSFPKSSR